MKIKLFNEYKWRLQRKQETNVWSEVTIRILAVVLALVIFGITIRLNNMSVISSAKEVIKGTLGNSYGIQQLFILATPIMMTGLAYVLGSRMQLFNTGVEGQFFVGALTATSVGLYIKGNPILVLALMFIAGAIGGALLAFIPALLRSYANVNEILTTLMLNFVAILLVQHFAIGVWHDPGMKRATAKIIYELPTIFGSSVHVGIVIAILIAIIITLTLRGTRWGYELTTIGGNQKAAEYSGMPVKRNLLLVLLISGMIAGIGGMIEVAGTTHRLSDTISNEYGWTGIIAASMAGGSPIVTVFTSFFMAFLLNMGIVLQTEGLNIHIVTALNGLLLLFMAIGEVIARYRLVRNSSGENENIEVLQKANSVNIINDC